MARYVVGPIPDPEGLGPLQEEILRRMLAAYERMEAPGPGTEFYRRGLEQWGVRWDHLQAEWRSSPSGAAAASRALRRLEDRGLVQRRNQSSGDQYGGYDPKEDAPTSRKHRTTHVRFTPEGRVKATRLTKR